MRTLRIIFSNIIVIINLFVANYIKLVHWQIVVVSFINRFKQECVRRK